MDRKKGKQSMTREEACKLIDDRMCYGRGVWTKHHQPVIDNYWEAGTMAIKALNEQQEFIEQLRWERDTAIQQLNKLGYGLGEEIRTDTDTIYRQAAIDAIAELQGRASSKGELTGISKAWKKIKALPSAQPEIIRCENCKHHYKRGCPFAWKDLLNDDDYCSYADRRTDGVDS